MLKPKTTFLKFLYFIKVVKISYKHMPKYAKICIVMVSSVCGIALQEVQTMKRNRFYSENKFAKCPSQVMVKAIRTVFVALLMDQVMYIIIVVLYN